MADTPPASAFKICSTLIRSPWIVGFPTSTFGSAVIRCSSFSCSISCAVLPVRHRQGRNRPCDQYPSTGRNRPPPSICIFRVSDISIPVDKGRKPEREWAEAAHAASLEIRDWNPDTREETARPWGVGQVPVDPRQCLPPQVCFSDRRVARGVALL